MTDPDTWTDHALRLCDELTAAGKLRSPSLKSAVREVPRHVFVPSFYEQDGPSQWRQIRHDDPETSSTWWNEVWSNRSLVTQLGPVPNGRRDATGPTSSSSAPSLMTRMIEALDLQPGHRVLEIGTGSGYNAALLCHQLGDGHVFSIDVDAQIVDDARNRLEGLGYTPTLAAADGAGGWPDHAPYDRIEATCAVSWVPWAWAEQTTPGGLVLTDVKIHTTAGNLVLLRRERDRLEGRFDPGVATFMHMRTPLFTHSHTPWPERDLAEAAHDTTHRTVERVWGIGPLWFLIHLQQPSRLDFGYAMNPDTGGLGNAFFASADGSWCELSPPDADGHCDVWQGGPRRLWDGIKATIDLWHQLGEPAWNRLGLTVTADRQQVWIDEPGSTHHWDLPTRQE